MSRIDYNALSDQEKLELLQLLYSDTSHYTDPIGAKEMIVEETQRVYNRLKKRSH